jgi:dienelactone hydrolase
MSGKLSIRTAPRHARALRATVAVALAAAVAIGGGLAGTVPAAQAATQYQRGPAPTVASLEAAGPFATTLLTLSDSQTPSTFGASYVYYPNSTSEGTYAAIALVPGWAGTRDDLKSLAARLASHGFVTITFDTNASWTDGPTQRETAVLAALDWLVASSPTAAKSRIDPTRTAIAGYSMGGGGVLQALTARPSLKAGVAMAPWEGDSWDGVALPHSFPTISSPTLVLTGDADTYATPSTMGRPFYNSIGTTVPKSYGQVVGADHGYWKTTSALTSLNVIAWMKRFVDNDSRYEQFLCPQTVVSPGFAASANTCGTY